MSIYDSEKLQNAQQSNLDLLQQMSSRAFEGAEQLAYLNFKALRASADEHFTHFRKLLSVRDAQGLAETQASLANPTEQLERMMEYSRQVYDLVSSTQADIASLLEKQMQSSSQQMQAAIEEMAKNAPAGSEPMVAAFKSALEGANSLFENAQKAARQATDITENGIASAASAGRQAAREATEAANAATRPVQS